jgi:6-phosphogluconolactonase
MTPRLLPWLVLASSLTSICVQAKSMTDYDVLVGAYTAGASEGIYRLASTPRPASSTPSRVR